MGLTGINEDGRTLLDGYDGNGKDKIIVADELIDRAIDMGFLSEGGEISFSIDTPDIVLFQEYGIELRTNVTQRLDGPSHRYHCHYRLSPNRRRKYPFFCLVTGYLSYP